MSDTNKNVNNPAGNNSLFIYTALIFIAAIIIIIFAYFTQTHLEKAQPIQSDTAVAASHDSDAPEETAIETGGPQGIAKTAAELSQDNLELLEENRELHKKVDELESQLSIYEPLIEAYHALIMNDNERIKLILEDIDYNSISDEAKTLYDFISTNIQ